MRSALRLTNLALSNAAIDIRLLCNFHHGIAAKRPGSAKDTGYFPCELRKSSTTARLRH